MYLRLKEYRRPTSLEGCLSFLGKEGTVPLAGGTFLNAGGHERIERLVDLQDLPLRGIELLDHSLRLGALLRLSELAALNLPGGFGVLAEAARAEKNLAIRNQSTLGGRLSRRRADARLATALVALAAEVEVLSSSATPWKFRRALVGSGFTPDQALREGINPSPTRGFSGPKPVPELLRRATRVVGLEDYLSRNPSEAAGSILTAAVIRGRRPEFSAYASFGLTAVDAPYADAAIACWADGRVRLVSGGHADDATGVFFLPLSSAAAEKVGESAEDWRGALRETVVAELPAYSNARVTGDYRRELAATLALRLVERGLKKREAR